MWTCKPAGSTLHSNSNKYNKISPKMSITSSATISWDWEAQSPNSLWDRLLVVSITKRDGTLLDASSILEEDIMELCVRRAHTHLLGVLWYSMADSVVFFNNVADVNRTQQVLPDVLEFCNEAVRNPDNGLWCRLTLQAFIKMWHLNPATWEGELHTPPYWTPPNEETPHHIHVQLGDLNDHGAPTACKGFVTRRLCSVNQWHPPAIPFLKIGHAHWAAVSQKKMSRRSPFQEGEGSLPDHHHGQ